MARREAIDEVRPVLEDIDKTLDVVEKGLDAVEKGADVGVEAVEKATHVAVEEVRGAVRWFRNPKVAVGVILVATGVSAGFLGWKLAQRHYNKKFETELELEIESARKFYTRLNKVDLTPEQLAEKHKTKTEVVEEAAEALKEYQDGPTQYDKIAPKGAVDAVADAVDEAVVEQNVFVNGRALVPDNFDVVEEARNRDPERPYVISFEEFDENTNDYPQNSITYYAGDDILADERDEVIDNVEDLVGQDNLARFGHGSRDKNVVYVRNERNGVDFEIAYSPGNYSEEVHGFIQHSSSIPRIRHGRKGDDG